ncbi:carbonic anhydrase [Polyplosphaeria fusca]|uniref:Carbonic anhydrase n=1 Tax=Polyplosphaeria fusca TaxID=682080 RepID=A0A9P4V1B8_9PLEO|nr:carbonic anhydrase [Polyplosphaeria fusca]
MAAKITLEELLKRNSAVAETHKAPLTLAQMAERGLAVTKTLVLSCADPRADPSYYLNLAPGEAVIYRNAGGQVRPLFNDILALDYLLQFEQVIIVHHTDCGTLAFTSDQVRGVLKERDPAAAAAADVDHGHFCGIGDIEQSVVDDLRLLKNSGLVREGMKGGVKGFLLDIETGKLKAVEAN